MYALMQLRSCAKWSERKAPAQLRAVPLRKLRAGFTVHIMMMMMMTLIGVIPMVIMAQSAENWRNTHTHVDPARIHSHTFTSAQLQPRCAKRQFSPYVSVHSGLFFVFP